VVAASEVHLVDTDSASLMTPPRDDPDYRPMPQALESQREWTGASHEARKLRASTPNPRGLPVETEVAPVRQVGPAGLNRSAAPVAPTRSVVRHTDQARPETPPFQPTAGPATRNHQRTIEPFEVDPALVATAPASVATPGPIPIAAVPPLPKESRAIPAPPPLTTSDDILEVEADRIDGTFDQVITATGQAYVRRGWDELFGDVLRWNVATNQASGEGNIVKRDRDSEVTGTRFTYDQATSTGKVDDAGFSITSANGKGVAGNLSFDGPGRYAGREDVRYTTCDFNDPDWLLKAESVEIDENANQGVAHGARILAGGKLPVLYLPKLEFALTSERKSGFLTPSVSITTRTGPQVFVPYYWNIATNMDATITPRYMSKRGLQIGGEFRYLESDFAGHLRGEYMPTDDVLGKQRWAIALAHLHRLDGRTAAYINYEAVSDDAYFRDLTNRLGNPSSVGNLGSSLAGLDFMRGSVGATWGSGSGSGGRLLSGTATRLLPQSAGINYSGDNWDLTAKVRSFQLLQDPSKPITQPYQALPSFTFTGNRLIAGVTDVKLDASFSSFSLRYLEALPVTRRNGERLVLNPSISIPIRSLWGYIEPRAMLHASYYSLDPASGAPGTLSRNVPTLSVDSGMLFERRISTSGAVQTFEPRVFYAYTPYRDQTRIPVFDTGRYNFNFAEIFSANRFTGQDRIGDANQWTAGFVTRFIDEKGSERVKVALAQRFTLSDLRVGQNDPLIATDAPKKGVSDILGEFSGRILDSASVISRVQYSPETSDVQKALVGLRYNPELGKVINLGYRYTRELNAAQLGLDQVDLSAQWPLSGNLYALARSNYSLLDKRQTEGLLGLEYYGSCWSVRAVVQNLALTANTSTKALFVVLELKGIAGADPGEYNTILSRNIGGYSKIDYDKNRTTQTLFQ
jgi:LPS-assembly protein